MYLVYNYKALYKYKPINLKKKLPLICLCLPHSAQYDALHMGSC